MKNFLQFIVPGRIDTVNYESYQEDLNSRRVEVRIIQEIILKGSYCHACGEFYDPRIMDKFIFEDHHYSGRRNSPLVIPVCPNCHKWLSLKQRGWDNRWMDAHNSDSLKLAFHLRGLSDILMVYSQQSREWSDRILRGRLT